MKYSLSGITIFLIIVVLFVSQFFFRMWDKNSILSGGDAWGYYSYLPAVFIHHDLDNLKQSLTARYHEDYNRTIDTTKHLEGEFSYAGDKLIIKYTFGVAFLQSPFFGVAHLLAKPLGFTPNGYSKIYVIALHISLLFYALLGLLFVRALLLSYYSEAITSAVLVILALSTNLYYFVVLSTPMSHVYLFFLFSVLLHVTKKFYQNFEWKFAIAIGFCCGLITLIRPNEIAAILIPVCFGITGIKTLQQRGGVFKKEWLKLLTAAIAFTLPILPLLIYWKVMSGHWLYFSYPNETFDFKHPHIFEGLFGYMNGWLAYTPVMYLGVAGLVLLLIKRNEWGLGFSLFIVQHVFVIYSWWCWYYINGFGSRPMVETYPLWAIAVAALFFYIRGNLPIKILVGALTFFCIALNIFQTWQFDNNLLVSEFGNGVFVRHTMFKTSLTAAELVEYDCGFAQPTGLTRQREILRYGFEDSTDTNFETLPGRAGFAYKITGEPKYVPNCCGRVPATLFKKGEWVKASIWCKPVKGSDLLGQSSLVVNFRRGDTHLQYSIMRLQNKVLKPKVLHPYEPRGEEGLASFFVPVPDNLQQGDEMIVFIEATPKLMFVDDVLIEVWK